MNPPAPSRHPEPPRAGRGLTARIRRLVANCLGPITVAGALCSGCATGPLIKPYEANNVFKFAPKLPDQLVRVAVLPLMCDESHTDLAAGRDALESVFLAELIKTKKFEVVRVTPEEMLSLTGREHWNGQETLPSGFFDKLRERFGCDGVLMGQLTEFRAYAPLAVGWRLKLVDTHSCSIVWAGDEFFDAGLPGVQAGAVHYQRKQQRDYAAAGSDWLSLNSPRQFGQYAVAQLFDTLPVR